MVYYQDRPRCRSRRRPAALVALPAPLLLSRALPCRAALPAPSRANPALAPRCPRRRCASPPLLSLAQPALTVLGGCRAAALAATPLLSLPMRPALSSRVRAALPDPLVLSLTHPASSRVDPALAPPRCPRRRCAAPQLFLSLAYPALTPLSSWVGAALPLLSPLRCSCCSARSAALVARATRTALRCPRRAAPAPSRARAELR